MWYQTVDFFKSTPYKTIKTDQLLIKITLLNIADLNEITYNHDNELTERKDPALITVVLPAIAAGVAVAAAVHKTRGRRRRFNANKQCQTPQRRTQHDTTNDIPKG